MSRYEDTPSSEMKAMSVSSGRRMQPEVSSRNPTRLPQAIDDLQSQINELRNFQKMLREKLDPVMSPPEPSAAMIGQDVPGGDSEVVNRIRQMTEELQQTMIEFGSIYERLQV